jgi:putative spermidine/putrescine transport system ATP-binding protein
MDNPTPAPPPPRFDVELVAVTKRYGSVVAVDNVSLRVPHRSYCCLLGPSGCGKTSTLRMIAGHETVSDGDILIHNRNVTEFAPVQRGTAMMFQNYALFPHRNCLDNVAFSLKMRGVKKTERYARAREFLTLVQMEELAERLPGQLSGGQQQRVALARALITSPACCCSTSRCRRSTRSCACRCAANCDGSSVNSASPSSMSPMRRTRRWRWPI